jgi:hypothetical protein
MELQVCGLCALTDQKGPHLTAEIKEAGKVLATVPLHPTLHGDLAKGR